MTAVDLIRDRYHADITPQERAWLVDLLAAIREDIRQAKKEAKETTNDED